MVAVLTGDATLKLLTMEHYKDDKRYTLFTHVEALSGIFAGKKGYVESATIQND